VPAIKDAKLAYALLESLKVDRDRIHLVVNRADAPTNVAIVEVEKHLKATVVATVPSLGKAVLRSIQDGVPLIKLEPESEFSNRIRDLAQRLIPLAGAGDRATKSGRRRFWARST
jgi:pilus assembly protein CpaE